MKKITAVKNPRSRKRGFTRRVRRPRMYKNYYGKIATELLRQASAAFEACAGLDTAVRDSVSQGLAYLVEAAYDSEAVARGLEGDAFDSFRRQATAEWFRQREYVEWFCEAASVCFITSKPRTNFAIVFAKGHRIRPRCENITAGPPKKKTATRKRLAGGNE
jgi:hypothetical protein